MNYPIKVFNDKGRDGIIWAVRVVRKGDLKWLDGDVLYEGELPIVQFYDCQHEFGPLGQFVADYHIDTLLEDGTALSLRGLALQGNVPSWGIGGPTMKRILKWLSTFAA